MPDMTASTPQLSFARLAGIYPVSRQRLQQIGKIYGRKILLNPDKLAAKLLPDVFRKHEAAPLVDCLRDPGERQRIKSEIKRLTAKA